MIHPYLPSFCFVRSYSELVSNRFLIRSVNSQLIFYPPFRNENTVSPNRIELNTPA